jgi:isochorismate synthase
LHVSGGESKNDAMRQAADKENTFSTTDESFPAFSDRYLDARREMGAAMAVWRMPGEAELTAVIDFAPCDEAVPVEFSTYPCFLCGGFKQYPGNEPSACVIKGDLLIQWGSEADLTYSSDKQELVDSFFQACSASTGPVTAHPAPDYRVDRNNLAHFRASVVSALQTISSHKLEKVVLAARHTFKVGETVEPAQLFDALCRSHPDAFVSLVQLADGTIWIGASPELLVSSDRKGVFRTAAVAGTQQRKEGQAPRDVVWRQKEIEEQALVSRFIIDQFKKIRLREFKEEGPRTVQAGNLFHLKTDFSVDTQAVKFPGLHKTMLSLLHPTSAVCGSPRDPAMSFIKEHETFDRELYSGFLGPVCVEDETNLFVNLRCIKLEGDTLSVFAGAGVTHDSDPDEEVDEVLSKFSSTLHVLKSSADD